MARGGGRILGHWVGVGRSTARRAAKSPSVQGPTRPEHRGHRLGPAGGRTGPKKGRPAEWRRHAAARCLPSRPGPPLPIVCCSAIISPISRFRFIWSLFVSFPLSKQGIDLRLVGALSTVHSPLKLPAPLHSLFPSLSLSRLYHSGIVSLFTSSSVSRRRLHRLLPSAVGLEVSLAISRLSLLPFPECICLTAVHTHLSLYIVVALRCASLQLQVDAMKATRIRDTTRGPFREDRPPPVRWCPYPRAARTHPEHSGAGSLAATAAARNVRALATTNE